MKILKKTLKIVGIILLIMVIALTIFIFTSGPKLPKNTDQIIEEVMNAPLSEMLKGKTGYAHNNGVKIWFESIEPKGEVQGTYILSMGISNDAMAWPPKFIADLVKSGYRVVRYDYRGCGMSDWIKDWSEENAYSLSDMSDDGLAILYALNIDKAHFIGVSMGGMVAQQTAIEHPEKVLSLISIMSSGYITDPKLPELNMSIITDFVLLFIKYGIIKSEANQIKLQLASRYVLMGDSVYDFDIKEIAEQTLYNLRKRNGYNNNVSKQHNRAVFISGSRYKELAELQLPVLLIHGNSDPFIPVEHSKIMAKLIPHADTLWVKGMGHDIPDLYNDEVIEKILEFTELNEEEDKEM